MDLEDFNFNLDLSDITDINIDLDVMLNDLIDILATLYQCLIQMRQVKGK